MSPVLMEALSLMLLKLASVLRSPLALGPSWALGLSLVLGSSTSYQLHPSPWWREVCKVSIEIQLPMCIWTRGGGLLPTEK